MSLLIHSTTLMKYRVVKTEECPASTTLILPSFSQSKLINTHPHLTTYWKATAWACWVQCHMDGGEARTRRAKVVNDHPCWGDAGQPLTSQKERHFPPRHVLPRACSDAQPRPAQQVAGPVLAMGKTISTRLTRRQYWLVCKESNSSRRHLCVAPPPCRRPSAAPLPPAPRHCLLPATAALPGDSKAAWTKREALEMI